MKALNAATQARRAVLAKMEKMTPKEVLEVSIRTGIYDGPRRRSPPGSKHSFIRKKPDMTAPETIGIAKKRASSRPMRTKAMGLR